MKILLYNKEKTWSSVVYVSYLWELWEEIQKAKKKKLKYKIVEKG